MHAKYKSEADIIKTQWYRTYHETNKLCIVYSVVTKNECIDLFACVYV